MKIITTDVSVFIFKQFQCQLCMIVGKENYFFTGLPPPALSCVHIPFSTMILYSEWNVDTAQHSVSGPVIVNIVEL